MQRCSWPRSELDILYHDREWGVPEHGDRALFELLTLEGAQAGLSWSTILNKRDAYREAFVNFDPAHVARFSAARVERLLSNPGSFATGSRSKARSPMPVRLFVSLRKKATSIVTCC